MYEIPKDCPYTATGVKTMRGREGDAYEATIRRDGKKVGGVHDDGNGGCLDLFGFSKPEMEAVEAYAKALPPYEPRPEQGMTEALPMSLDCFLAELVNHALLLKDAKTWQNRCAHGVVFRRPEDPAGTWTILGSKAAPVALEAGRAHLARKYPAGVVILNDHMAKDPLAFERLARS